MKKISENKFQSLNHIYNIHSSPGERIIAIDNKLKEIDREILEIKQDIKEIDSELLRIEQDINVNKGLNSSLELFQVFNKYEATLSKATKYEEAEEKLTTSNTNQQFKNGIKADELILFKGENSDVYMSGIGYTTYSFDASTLDYVGILDDILTANIQSTISSLIQQIKENIKKLREYISSSRYRIKSIKEKLLNFSFKDIYIPIIYELREYIDLKKSYRKEISLLFPIQILLTNLNSLYNERESILSYQGNYPSYYKFT